MNGDLPCLLMPLFSILVMLDTRISEEYQSIVNPYMIFKSLVKFLDVLKSHKANKMFVTISNPKL
jgi:hypothetical protein